jgi:regulator of nucleoside diphosphate kinase
MNMEKTKMKHREIYITQHDLSRLQGLVNAASGRYTGKDREHLFMLAEELDRGHIIESAKTPPDIITMNTTVRIRDLQTDKTMIYSLVFPHKADIDQNKLSVLAPLGTALLGFRVGDIIEWPVPAGTRHIQILEILYQPEAAGDYQV